MPHANCAHCGKLIEFDESCQVSFADKGGMEKPEYRYLCAVCANHVKCCLDK